MPPRTTPSVPVSGKERPPPPSSRALEEIREKPKAGWSIDDVGKACRQLEMECMPPSRGSHYKISSPFVAGILTVPSKRPIKLPYIKLFLSFADAHIQNATSSRGKSDG